MSKTVFVGRIPYDYTEEQLSDIFQTAGPVKETRLILDKAGKSKGFAFVEYFDADAAASAVRNLDDYRVGSMKLRVNLSQEQSNTFSGRAGGGRRQAKTQDGGQAMDSAINYIANLISDSSPEQKLGFLTDMKQFALEHTPQATALLSSQPQLAYSIVQTLIDIGRIDFTSAQALVDDGTPTSTPRLASTPSLPTTMPSLPAKMPSIPSSQPPVPAALPRQTPQPSPGPEPDSQKEIMRQLMALSDEQVAMLPPSQRAVAQSLRIRVRAGEIVL